jgi:hypothetical protein
MIDSIYKIEKWHLPPDIDAYKNYLELLKNKNRYIGIDYLEKDITSYPLYVYLKARFGEPNGSMMALRHPSSDNYIQWNYLIFCEDKYIDFICTDTKIQVVINSITEIEKIDVKKLVEIVKNDFKNFGKELKSVKNKLEKWTVFVNPYKRLENVIKDLESEYNSLNLENIKPPTFSNTTDNLKLDQENISNYLSVYNRAVVLGTSITMILPILGEAFINLLIFLLAKNEIKTDNRLMESLFREQIDLRVKKLHLNCNGFDKPINGDDQRFKDFHSLMNGRNDFLHGNIDPFKFSYEEVYFDDKIPLYNSDMNFFAKAATNQLKFIEPTEIKERISIVKNFITFILESLTSAYKNEVLMLMNTINPGYNPVKNKVGILFSNFIMEPIRYGNKK